MICFAARKLDSTEKLFAETCLFKSPSGQIVTGAIFTADLGLCSDSRRERSWAESTARRAQLVYHLT